MIARRTRKLAVFGAVACALGAAAILALACFDITPVVVPARDASSFARLDGGCRSCLGAPPEQGGCNDILDECRGDQGCDALLACVDSKDCFDGPTDDDKVACAYPCFIEAGIATLQDPRIQRVFDLVKCGQKGCPMCNFGEAGTIGPDAF